MSRSIRISDNPENDVHMTSCTRCGGDGPGIILGTLTKLYQCRECDTLLYGTSKCPTHGRTGMFVRKLEPNEKIPNGICDDCKKELAEHKAIVAAGGIYWKCPCGASGVIKGESQLAKDVRTSGGIPAPDPIGVDFEGACPSCAPEKFSPP